MGTGPFGLGNGKGDLKGLRGIGGVREVWRRLTIGAVAWRGLAGGSSRHPFSDFCGGGAAVEEELGADAVDEGRILLLVGTDCGAESFEVILHRRCLESFPDSLAGVGADGGEVSGIGILATEFQFESAFLAVNRDINTVAFGSGVAGGHEHSLSAVAEFELGGHGVVGVQCILAVAFAFEL